jgi:hypothetical protein
MISSSLTQIVSSTLPPLSSKSGKVLFSSTKLVIEQKYLFKTSAFSLPWRLTPLSTIFQLYRGVPEKTTNLL